MRNSETSKIFYNDGDFTTESSISIASKPGLKYHHRKGGIRHCSRAKNGTAVWGTPNLSLCRGLATRTAESEAKELADLTSSVKTINQTILADAAKKINSLVSHAITDKKVRCYFIIKYFSKKRF